MNIFIKELNDGFGNILYKDLVVEKGRDAIYVYPSYRSVKIIDKNKPCYVDHGEAREFIELLVSDGYNVREF